MTPQQEKILALKGSRSPQTGLPLTYVEIGKRLGMSSAMAWLHVKPILANRCPGCLRELKAEK